MESLFKQALRRVGEDATTRKACNSSLPGLLAPFDRAARDSAGSGESLRVSLAVLRSIQAPDP